MTAERKRFFLKVPVSVVTAMLLALLGAVAVLNLWLAVRVKQRSLQFEAGVSAIEHGRAVVQRFAALPVMGMETMSPSDWAEVTASLDLIGAMENGIVSLAVEDNGVVVFQGAPQLVQNSSAGHDPGEQDYVRIGVRNIETFSGPQQSLSFSRIILLPSGAKRRIELVMMENATYASSNSAIRAVKNFFGLSRIVFLATVGACLLAVMALLRFDKIRHEQSRRQEQLALAGAVTGGILHDFRNPLSSLTLDVQLLRKELGKGAQMSLDKAKDLAARLQGVLERFDMILKEAVMLSRPESENPDFETLDIRECIQRSLELLRPRFERAGLSIVAELPNTPLKVWGQSSLLVRALLNLLINAEQHSPASGQVFVRLRRNSGRIEVEIADQGPGIERRDRRRVFDLYFSRRPGGAGLGLFLARTAVEDCAGTLELGRSIQGASFIIALPAVKDNAHEKPARKELQ